MSDKRETQLEGLWRLERVSSRGKERTRGVDYTHLCIRGDRAWFVIPERALRPGDPWRMSVQLDPPGIELRIEDRQHGRDLDRCGVFELDGNTLRIDWNERALYVEDDGKALDVFARVEDPNEVARLAAPPRVDEESKPPDPVLGDIRYDDKRREWVSVIDLGVGVKFHFDAPPDASGSAFDPARAAVADVQAGLDAIRSQVGAILASDPHNGWLANRSPRLTAEQIASHLAVESISLANNRLEVIFDDGGLFGGHTVMVDLDQELKPVRCDIWG